MYQSRFHLTSTTFVKTSSKVRSQQREWKERITESKVDKGQNDKDMSEDDVWREDGPRERRNHLWEKCRRRFLLEFFTMHYLKLTINTSLF